jgi:hypothetical protein
MVYSISLLLFLGGSVCGVMSTSAGWDQGSIDADRKCDGNR